MDQSEVRKIIADQFEQSIAASGVRLSAIPDDQMRAVVDGLADGVFAVFAALEAEDDAFTPVSTPADENPNPELRRNAGSNEMPEEVLIWKGRPYLTIGTRYELTNQRLRVIRGILGQNIEEIELVRIQDTKVKQHAGERMLNVGDVSIFSADSTTPELVLRNVRNPIDVRESIRKATLEERNRRNLYYREDIG